MANRYIGLAREFERRFAACTRDMRRRRNRLFYVATSSRGGGALRLTNFLDMSVLLSSGFTHRKSQLAGHVRSLYRRLALHPFSPRDKTQTSYPIAASKMCWRWWVTEGSALSAKRDDVYKMGP